VRLTARRIRIHGDFHAGQVLWTGRDVVIIDFEGEPARPLSERRRKRSALVDVAGMIRSFHYAAHGSLTGSSQDRAAVRPGDPAILERWLAFWYLHVSAAFLRGYRDAAGDGPFVPRDDEEFARLLDAFLLEKAIYELGYELNNRPDWISIPIRGITELLAS
jgi:maltose alpha-D-glucosyltransferase/alpha-amylase